MSSAPSTTRVKQIGASLAFVSLFATAASGFAAAPAVATADTSLSTGQIIAAVNQQRTANGLPPVVENAAWSHGCKLHDRWMSRNGLSHYETPGTQFYTPEGADAGASSALAQAFVDSAWRYSLSSATINPHPIVGAISNPWNDAPAHLAPMMNPMAQTVGVDDSNGYACYRPGYGNPSAAPPVAWYAGPGGPQAVPYAQQTGEIGNDGQPLYFVPDGFGPTGQFILLYTLIGAGTQALTTPVTMTGPSGPVRTHVVSQGVAATALIFTERLKPDTSYTVTAAVNGQPVSLAIHTMGKPRGTIDYMPKKLRKGKSTLLLAETTDTNDAVKWKSLTPRICYATNKKYMRSVTARRRGTCKLRATVIPYSEIEGGAGYRATYRLRVTK